MDKLKAFLEERLAECKKKEDRTHKHHCWISAFGGVLYATRDEAISAQEFIDLWHLWDKYDELFQQDIKEARNG